eukprot:355138-Chlamydomonas_euryale.AAC.4
MGRVKPNAWGGGDRIGTAAAESHANVDAFGAVKQAPAPVVRAKKPFRRLFDRLAPVALTRSREGQLVEKTSRQQHGLLHFFCQVGHVFHSLQLLTFTTGHLPNPELLHISTTKSTLGV